MKEDVEKAKIENIIDMALTFSAMKRVFEKKSTKKIKQKLNVCIDEFMSVNSKEEYIEMHKKFCMWFTKNIKTAERKKGGKIKRPQPASYGQAAKIIDVVLKVCIYYCELPSDPSKIMPWLNCPIDSNIIDSLKKDKHLKTTEISQIKKIKDIDERKYEYLQKIIRKKSSKMRVCSIVYDDIIRRKIKDNS